MNYQRKRYTGFECYKSVFAKNFINIAHKTGGTCAMVCSNMIDYNIKQYEANNSGRRYIIHQGGTGSGKTYSIMQYLVDYAFHHQDSVISVVAKTMPHLQRGAMRDIKRILAANGWTKNVRLNKTDSCYYFGTSVIEFFPADDEAKLKGPKRDILFINECNNVDYYSYDQLDVRTRKCTLLDFNSVRRFWVHDKLLPALLPEEFIFVKSSYLDNKYLGDAEKRNIERRRQNTNWWRVYGEGEVGAAEGLVLNNWEIYAGELPGNLLGYGIDFGFSHSPTALVQVNEYNGEWYVHEWLYKTGMQNEELLSFIKTKLPNLREGLAWGQRLIVADCASPLIIEYLNRNGIMCMPSKKGEGSVEFGINMLLERKINVTALSLNLIKELQNYMWNTDKNGNSTGTPVKDFDHAIDAMRYLITYPKKKKLIVA